MRRRRFKQNVQHAQSSHEHIWILVNEVITLKVDAAAKIIVQTFECKDCYNDKEVINEIEEAPWIHYNPFTGTDILTPRRRKDEYDPR
ncbi:MAG: hypothetical protein HRT98_04480 [Mycoplasmatales bacterium]|nr:hypothetical protein [Mycoplasmatales bacterium]